MEVKVASELTVINLKAIGIVRNGIKHPRAKPNWGKVVSEIVVDPSLTEALDSLGEFSHIIVLYWMHQLPRGKPPTKVHLRGNQGLPLVGLFASRSPNRPNPIGKTTVRLLQLQGNTLKVEGLDAINGTPIIDMKAYIPGYDSGVNATMPQWRTSSPPL